MALEPLTTKLIDSKKPGPERIELRDSIQRGLAFILHPSGKKSWAVRYRRPGDRTRSAALCSCLY